MFFRIALFLAANFGVLTVLSVSSRVFGLEHWLAQQGMAGQLNGLADVFVIWLRWLFHLSRHI